MLDLQDKLNDLLVGRSIVEGNDAGLTLDNGQRITFDEYGECCAYASVEDVARETNVITRVSIDRVDGGLRIFALVQGSDSTLFKIVGNEGTGYYPYGVELHLDGAEVLDIRRPLDY